MSFASCLPATAGVGFKPQHFADILRGEVPIGFIEIHAENYMGDGGPPHAQLSALRERFALSVHGVGLSIGGAGPLDAAHLARVKALCERHQSQSFSEHLAWSSHGEVFYNDLLPLPYTEETLARIAGHIDEVQTAIGPSDAAGKSIDLRHFHRQHDPETEFLDALARRTGCGLLLDVNNVFVSAVNHGTDPAAYLAAFPLAHVKEIHLGGHDAQSDDAGAPLLIDAHGTPVADPVWALMKPSSPIPGPSPHWLNGTMTCRPGRCWRRRLARRGASSRARQQRTQRDDRRILNRSEPVCRRAARRRGSSAARCHITPRARRTNASRFTATM